MAKGVLGAQMYSVRNCCKTIDGVVESLAKIKAIGYTTVQVSGIGKEVSADELARAVADSGLVVAATHRAWAEFTDDLDGLIARHKALNCIHPAVGTLPGEYYVWPDGMAKFIAELAPVAERLAEAGMDFAYHNHHKELMRIEGKCWLEMLYERTTPAQLKPEIDTYWIQAGGGDPAEWIARYPGRQPLLHLKDMTVTTSKEVRFAPVGEGNLNWPAILAAAKAAGVEHYLVEQDDSYETDPFDALAASYRNLKAMGLS